MSFSFFYAVKIKNIRCFLWFFLSFLIFILYFVLQGNTQAQDYFNYTNIYNSVPNLFSFDPSNTGRIWGQTKEIGFLYWNSLFKTMNISSELFYIITALVIISIKAYGYSRISKAPVLLLLFYFSYDFFIDLNILRQGLASAFILVSYVFLARNNNFKIWFVFIILASTIHVGAIFVLLAYPLLKSDSLSKYYVFFLVISVCIALMGGLGKLVVINVGSVIFSNGDYLAGKIFAYTNHEIERQGLLTLQNLKYIAFFLIVFFLHRKDSQNWRLKLLCDYLFIGCIFNFIFVDVPQFSSRVVFYYYVVTPFIIDQLLIRTKQQQRYIMFILIILFTFVYFQKVLYEFYGR